MKIRDPFEDRPPKRDDETEREKRSWRELDAKRDRSAHVAPQEKPQDRGKSFTARRNESLAKQALDSLFQGKKSKEQEQSWKKVCEGTSKTFSNRAKKYVEKYGFPYDWDDLLRLLDHQDSAFVEDVLNRMMSRASDETEIRRDLLIGKIRVLRMEREEPALLDKFEKILDTLSKVS